MKEITIPVWLQNRLMSAYLDPVLNHTENKVSYSIISSFMRLQKCTNIILKPVLLERQFFCLEFYFKNSWLSHSVLKEKTWDISI